MLQKRPLRTRKRFFDLHGILVITTALCVAFSCLLLYFIASWVMHSQKEDRLRKEGHVAQGEIVSLRVPSVKVGSFRLGPEFFYPTIEFVDQIGNEHRFESPFQQSNIQIGDTIKVFYLLKDPDYVLIDGAAKWTYHPYNLALITACWLFAVFVGYAGIRTYCLEMYYGISVLQS